MADEAAQPSFHHVAALEEVLLGCTADQLEPALASVGYVIGDVANNAALRPAF